MHKMGLITNFIFGLRVSTLLLKYVQNAYPKTVADDGSKVPLA
jgi:hypothetical protein